MLLFSGEFYTLIMIDPDAFLASFGTNERPYLHWLLINAQNGIIENGRDVHSYAGPRPPYDAKFHTYYFLLYKQASNQPINVANMGDYTIGCDR